MFIDISEIDPTRNSGLFILERSDAGTRLIKDINSTITATNYHYNRWVARLLLYMLETGRYKKALAISNYDMVSDFIDEEATDYVYPWHSFELFNDSITENRGLIIYNSDLLMRMKLTGCELYQFTEIDYIFMRLYSL